MAKTALDFLHSEGIGLTLIGVELSLSLQTLIKDDGLIGGTFGLFSEAKGGANPFKGFIVRILQVFVTDKDVVFHEGGHLIEEVAGLNLSQLKDVLIGSPRLHVPILSNLRASWFVMIGVDGLIEKGTW